MPPEIEYGICSYRLTVLEAPLHPNRMSTKPRGMRIPPATSIARAPSDPPAFVRSSRPAEARLRWRSAESRSTAISAAVEDMSGAPLLRPAAQVGGGDLVGDVLRLAHPGDPAVDHDGGVVGDGEGRASEL